MESNHCLSVYLSVLKTKFTQQGFPGLSITPEDISALQTIATGSDSCALSFECSSGFAISDDNPDSDDQSLAVG